MILHIKSSTCIYCKLYELGGEVLFTIQFGIAVKKKYASIRTGLTQQEALSYTAFGDVDNEVYIECTDAIDHGSPQNQVLPVNPLHHGFFLSALITGTINGL